MPAADLQARAPQPPIRAAAYHLPFLLVFISVIAACASPPVRLQPASGSSQAASDGLLTQPPLKSVSPHRVGLHIIDYSDDEILIEVSVSNMGENGIALNEESVTGTMISDDGEYPVDVVHYDELLESRNDTTESAWLRTGAAAISVGSAFIPYGGIAVNAAQLLFTLGNDGGGSLDDRVDAQSYLRTQNIEANTFYAGQLKIHLPKPLESGDVLVLQVSAPNETHDFRFVCK